MSIEPGVHLDMPEDIYHADKESLSVSGMKRLLPPSCPAVFKWERDHGQPSRAVLDFGRAAHALLLGTGGPVRIVQADDWRGKAARAERDAAYAAGEDPILAADWATVQAMRDALAEQFGDLFTPGAGVAEQSLFWDDPDTGVRLRARLDWTVGRRFIVDYKTAPSANPWRFAKACADYGYDMQAAHYLDGARALGVADEATEFVFIVQEKTPPYVASAVILQPWEIDRGRVDVRRAIETYEQCIAKDDWPGYSSEIAYVSLPPRYGRDADGVSA